MPNTSISSLSFLPRNNWIVADQLFALEVGLRELMIETFTESDGPLWYKRCLPPDVVTKYIRGIQAERAANWSSHVEHHPLYYIDYPDLAKIIERNWKDAFQKIFSDKVVLVGNLKAIEPIRNKLAHNRILSDADRGVVEGIVTSLVAALGEGRFRRLVQQGGETPAIKHWLAALQDEIGIVRDAMLALAPVSTTVWERVKDAWWFDSDFLAASNHHSRLLVAQSKAVELEASLGKQRAEIGRLSALIEEGRITDDTPADNLAPVAEFFGLLTEYAKHPRGRGSGYRLEAWRNASEPEELAQKAINALRRMDSEGSHE